MPEQREAATERAKKIAAPAATVQTIASRFIILILCLALVLSTLAYGTVYYWSLAIFEIGAALIVFFWAVDAWRTHLLRFSRNTLQLPLAGLFLLGLVQLLPFGSAGSGAIAGVEPVRSLSFDPYSTRLALVLIAALFIYFAAALAFIDSPRRLRLIVNVIVIFGFLMAPFALIQSFVTPNKIYGLKELTQSTSFGPFVNRHHFAGYMEMTLALPLGLLFSGAIERERRILYVFAVLLMAVALVMTNSRGGLLSFLAELAFIFFMTRKGRGQEEEERKSEGVGARPRRALLRAGLALALLLALFTGVVMVGGEDVLSRFVGTVNAEDPTTGRSHYWATTLQIIRDHPVLGTGLGAFGLVYTRYDTRNGFFRLEQAHNDYLQVLSDAGVIGAVLGLFFIFSLFRMGFARRETEDKFRRGVAVGALAGCFAVLVHSFFDFILHTTSNALLFLVLAALATINGRVQEARSGRRRRRKRQTLKQPKVQSTQEGSAQIAPLPAHDSR